ncbi:YihY/virulence factor BrkB family protein [Lactococcus raffinolactis]|uniref:YihY/virulence factor BrkB family protein n=1 Tax=Pseudolactococcus raffinolactis TaxID=1366 RepID=UPI001FD9CCA4|nr:YihY/virulence factor BrkB family protein [Lactococcus raffinolactis]
MKNLIEKILASRRLNDFMFFYKSAEMNLSSIAVAYYLLLSLFPVLMIVGNILPFLHLDTAVILDFLQDNLPHQLYETVANIVESILSKPSTGLLSVSVLTGFWTFSKAMTSLQMAMNKAYEVSHHRDFLVSQFFLDHCQFCDYSISVCRCGFIDIWSDRACQDLQVHQV